MLLSRMIPDRLVNLLFDRIQIERSGVLHRRIAQRRAGEFRHLLLHQDEPPELSGVEVVTVAERAVECAFAPDHREPFEGILAKVYQTGHISDDFRPRPSSWLQEELKLHLVQADCAQFGSGEVKQLMSLRRPLALDQLELVVTVEVISVIPIAELDSLEQLAGDVGIAGGCAQRREPVETGEDPVLHRARLDVAWPTGDAGNAETAFERRPLLALEGRIAAVRPGERLSSVIRAENDDRVVGLSRFVKVLEQLTDTVIHL